MIGGEDTMMLWKRMKKAGACLLSAAVLIGTIQYPSLQAAAKEGNAAQSAVATASSSEESYGRGPDKLNDGIADDSSNRWAMENTGSSAWVQYAWSTPQKMKSFRIIWERRTAKSYQLEISDDGSSWRRISSVLETPEKTTVEITLDEIRTAKYLRLHVTSIDDREIDGMAYQSVSILEFEVYGADLPDPDAEHAQQIDASLTGIDKILADLDAPVIAKGDQKIYMPEIDGAAVRFCADYEQVIGEDGTIYPPLEDKTVRGFYEITSKESKESVKSDEYTIVVPGEYDSPGENKKPDVIPALQEWHGGTGNFILSRKGRILFDTPELLKTAEEFSRDYKEITGMDIAVSGGKKSDARPGDFCLFLAKEESGLGREGYRACVSAFVVIEAEDAVGAYWATRSMLQIIKQNKDSIPKGLIRDYPKYEVRALNLDVGRKPFTLEVLKDFVRNMVWYKLNSFQVHLNDNLIFLEDYTNGTASDEGRQAAIDQAYAGYRLESGKKNAEGKSATSEDLAYTKDEFRKFIKDSRTVGVDIVPEIDLPAHALSFTRVFPEYMSEGYNATQAGYGKYRYLIDELDISKQGAVALAKEIWADYLDGTDPVFDWETTVHIGTDEFLGGGEESGENFRVFSDELVKYIQSKGRTVRLWGSLSNKTGTTAVASDGVQANIWSRDYGTASDMYRLGFDLINTADEWLYMVPNGTGNRGAYGDYLDVERLYENWAVNSMFGYTIPAGDDQMLGACFAIWHDNIDTRANGYSQYDAMLRYLDTAPVFSEKLWGDASETCEYEAFAKRAVSMGRAPNTAIGAENEYVTNNIAEYTFEETLENDSGPNDFSLKTAKNASVADTGTQDDADRKAISLAGGESYVETPFDLMEPGTVLTMKVKLDADADLERSEQILCESKDVFGTDDVERLDRTDRTYALKASVNYSGNVGFSREGYGYLFDYTLPKGEWVELSFRSGVNGQVSLSINGTLIDENPDLYYKNHPETKRKGIHTLLVPFGRIGSKTDSFQGQVANITLSGTRKRGERPAVSKNELIETLKKYDGAAPDRYTDASRTAYEKAYRQARKVADFAGSTDEDCAYAAEIFQIAEEALHEKPEAYCRTEELGSAIESAEKMLQNTAGCTKQSIEALQAAVKTAKEALLDPNASLEEISRVLTALRGKTLEKETVKPEEETEETVFEAGGMRYEVISPSARTVKLVRGKDAPRVFVHTASYKGRQYQVKEIAAGAFRGCKKKLKKITIGANVEIIGTHAFQGCRKLANVVLKKNAKLRKVGSGAFQKTAKKIKVKLPKNLKKNKKLKRQLKKAGIKRGL